jgi:nitrite reductase/ring-hydroxylating ferredoxin subunit
MDADRRIAALDDVPTDSTLLVTLRPYDSGAVEEGHGDAGTADDGTTEAEAILLRLGDDVAAFRNYCQHWTDVRLDKDDGAFVREGEIFCQKHGATFQGDSGYCDFGPCEGATLDAVSVTVDDDAVYLTDDAYEFVRLGPATREGDASGSRIDFTGS